MTHEEDYSFARACMGPDEQILWRGKPQPGHLLSGSDVFMIPFSIFWCGFAIFWTATTTRIGAPFFFPIFGLFFVCIGLYLVFGRFLLTAWLRKHTAYVITNKKIIRRRGTKLDTLSAATMPPAKTEYRPDGSGTVRFQTESRYYRRGTGWQLQATGMDFGAFSIENVADISRVLQAIESMEK